MLKEVAAASELADRVAAAARAVDDVVALDDGGGRVATGAGEARVAGVAVHAVDPPVVTVRVSARLGRPMAMIDRDVRNRLASALDPAGEDGDARVAVEIGLAGARTPARAGTASTRRSRRQGSQPPAGRWVPARRTLAVIALLAGTAGFAVGGLEGIGPGAGEDPEVAPSLRQHPGVGTALEPAAGSAVSPVGERRQDLPADPDAEALLPRTHTVEPGDTFARIAARYDLPLDGLLRANAAPRRRGLDPGQTVVLPEPRGQRPASPEAAVAARLPIEGILEEVAVEHGRDPALIKAVAWQESRWNQRLVSSAGAIGVMQVRPTTGEVAASHVGRGLDLHDPVDNVTAGVAYLDILVARHGGDLRAALAAYFQGSQSVRRDGRFDVTERYVAEVAALRDRFAELSSPDGSGPPT